MIPWFQLQFIDFGYFKFYYWGIFVSLGLMAGMIVVYFKLKRKNLESGRIFDLAFWIILFALVGGRLLYALEHLPQYLNAPLSILKMWRGGMSVYGGFIGGFLAGAIYLKRNNLDFWKYADAIFFVLPLGSFIGRIGCFLIHDHPGTKTDFLLGVAFPDGVRHDLGLYLSLNSLIIFLIFLVINRKERFTGFYAAFFSAWYGITRFLLDFLRATDLPGADPRYLSLTLAQYLSLFLFVMGIFVFYKLRKTKKIDGGRITN